MGCSFRTKERLLGDRLDSTFYLPKLVENELRLRRSGLSLRPFESLVSNGRRVIYIDTHTLDREKAPSSWVRWITSDDFEKEGFFVDTETNLRVSTDFAKAYPKGRLRLGELLIKVKGPNQLAAYVERIPEIEIVLVSGTIWGCIVDKNIVDPWYLTTVFESPYGRTARTRRRVNTNVEFTSPNDLAEIKIPLPTLDAQVYIGNKVRQAEMLRQKTLVLDSQRKAITQEAIGFPYESKSTLGYKLIYPELGYRLDAKFYSPDANAVRTRLRGRSVTIRELNPIVSNGFEHRDFVEDGRPYLTVREVSSGRLIMDSAPRIPYSIRVPERANLTPQSVLVVRTGSICMSVLPMTEDCHACLSSDLIRLEFREKGVAGAVTAFLNSQHGRALLGAASYGAVQPHIGQEDLLDTPVPLSLVSHGQQVDELYRLSESAYRCSRRLTNAARLLVEALIEHKVTESELIAAHQDPARDRELLARLTPKGIDVAGEPPLFPDLDALYDLLGKEVGAV